MHLSTSTGLLYLGVTIGTAMVISSLIRSSRVGKNMLLTHIIVFLHKGNSDRHYIHPYRDNHHRQHVDYDQHYFKQQEDGDRCNQHPLQNQKPCHQNHEGASCH